MDSSAPSPAYIAGLFDGEGAVSVDSWGLVRLQIAMADQVAIEAIHATYGGSMGCYETRQGCRSTFKLVLSGKDAGKLIADILPFSLVKRKQLQIAQAVLATTGMQGKQIPAMVREFRDRCKYAIVRLNSGRK